MVTLSDDDLWNVPYIYMTGHGNVHWSDRDLATLRRYLLRGGFLHADDNYGMDRPSVASWPASFPTIPWSKFPSTTRFIISCTTFRRGSPRSTCTTASRRRVSASFSTAGWRSTTRTSRISGRLGRLRGPSRSSREARGRAPDGSEPVRLRRGVRRVTAPATSQALRRLARAAPTDAGAGWLALAIGVASSAARSRGLVCPARSRRGPLVGAGCLGRGDRSRSGRRLAGLEGSQAATHQRRDRGRDGARRLLASWGPHLPTR